jgi:hypothetical protein
VERNLGEWELRDVRVLLSVHGPDDLRPVTAIGAIAPVTAVGGVTAVGAVTAIVGRGRGRGR